MELKYLDRLCGHKVCIWTTNGYYMTGTLVSTEENCIILDVNGTEQMICKHAISTVRKAG